MILRKLEVMYVQYDKPYIAYTHNNCAFKTVIYLPEPQSCMSLHVLLQIRLHLCCEGWYQGHSPNVSNLRPSFCKIVLCCSTLTDIFAVLGAWGVERLWSF